MTKNELLIQLYEVENGKRDLSDVLESLEKDVYENSLKGSEKQCRSAMKRVLGSAQKKSRQYIHFCKIFTLNGVSYQMATDGYRAFAKKGKPFMDLPLVNEQETGNFPDLPRLFLKNPTDKIFLSMKQVNHAKAEDFKGTKKKDYPVLTARSESGQQIGFNADYVKDALDVLGVNEFLFDCHTYSSPIQGETEQGFALLCPVRLED